MKNIIFLFFIYITYGYTQERPSFFIEVLNVNYVPIVTHDSKGNKIAMSKTGNKSLDALINSYQIYSNERVFKSSNKASLQNIYQIVCNDLQLMNDLINNFGQLYPRLENAGGETLTLPNDFGTTGGYIDDQEELNYIRAQEAWDITTGLKEVIIGISDKSVQPNHEDLIEKANVVYGINYPNSNNLDQHGSRVSGVAAGSTDNGKGMSAIGYNSSIYNAVNNFVVGVDTLSQMPGVKVINTAWTSGSTMQDLYDEIVEDRKVVVVASAGNWYSSTYIYPASYGNVISVSSVGHQNRTWTDFWGNSVQTFLDGHEYVFNGQITSHQHNDSIDIVAPAIDVLVPFPRDGNGLTDYVNTYGTSYASPMTSGTIALMFSVNYCIDPKEVETILKLTAIKIDHLPQNIAFYGKLGAGKLDAYEAVKMAKDMADPYGTVEVKNRILYRPWFYKLETAPYEIKMTNNDVTGGSKLKFKARNNIEILSGDYYPDTGGYIDLSIDSTLALNCPPAPNLASKSANDEKMKVKNLKNNFEIMPTLVTQDVSITNKIGSFDLMSNIKIYNFYGIEVFNKDKINSDSIILNLGSLIEGIYILKVFNKEGETLYTQKIVKK